MDIHKANETVQELFNHDGLQLQIFNKDSIYGCVLMIPEREIINYDKVQWNPKIDRIISLRLNRKFNTLVDSHIHGIDIQYHNFPTPTIIVEKELYHDEELDVEEVLEFFVKTLETIFVKGHINITKEDVELYDIKREHLNITSEKSLIQLAHDDSIKPGEFAHSTLAEHALEIYHGDLIENLFIMNKKELTLEDFHIVAEILDKEYSIVNG